MRPFPTPEKVWPPLVVQGGTAEPQRRWEVYVRPDPDDERLMAFIRRCREIGMQVGGDALAPVSDAFLHATLLQVSVPSIEVGEAQRVSLVEQLRVEAAEVEPFAVTVGGPSAGESSVMLNLDQDLPGEPWAELSERVTAVVGRVVGDRALAAAPPPPHLTCAYGARQVDSGPIQSALRRRLRPQFVTTVIDAVWLLEVRQDAAAHTYTWDEATAIRIPLGAGSAVPEH
jgi:hypothetical protein